MEGAAASSYDRNPPILLSASEMIRFRDERKTLHFTLTGGQSIEGAVRWFDAETVHLVTADRSEVTVQKHAILYYGVAP